MSEGHKLVGKLKLAAAIFLLGSLALFFLNCSSETTSSPMPSGSLTCSVSQLESEMDAALDTATSEVDFSFLVERADGLRYVYNRGASTPQTSYESASTSKWVSAVIILRAVQNGDLSLTDRPQDHIGTWPLVNTDSLYNATLANFLSFTSGLYDEPSGPACLNFGGSDFQNCVNRIATANAGTARVPGAEFYYSSTHLQVAGLMTVLAKGFSNWQDVFSEFQSQTSLFPTSTYDLPSATNPRLAGGMHWTAEEYMAFLKSLKNGQILNSTYMAALLTDRTATAAMTYSPIMSGGGEAWHYGFGSWHECQSPTWNCTAGARISSPGAYGAYPFWDRTKNYFGIVARQGTLGTAMTGVNIERTVRSKVEEWVACQ